MLRTETKGRARALQLLYAAEARAQGVEDVMPGLARLTGPAPLVLDFAERLAAGVQSDQPRLDRLLEDATEHWKLGRLAMIDRNILRLGVFELSSPDIPPRVAIDQALWLAHRFGTVQSPGFINGVLDRVARTLGRL